MEVEEVDKNLLSLYEQVLYCRFDNQQWADLVREMIEPQIPQYLRMEMKGCCESHEQGQVVKVTSTGYESYSGIQTGSLVTIKSCLRWTSPGLHLLLVENAEGREHIINSIHTEEA